MIRRYISRSVLLLVFLDQLVFAGSFVAALWVKTHWLYADPQLSWRIHTDLFVRLWPLIAVVVMLVGAYDLQVAVGRLRPLLRRTLRASVAIAAVWIAGSFYLKMNEMFSYSRGVFTLFIVFSGGGMIAARLGAAEVVGWWRVRTGKYRPVLIFGGDQYGRKLIRNLERQVFTPIRVIGVTGEVDWPGVRRMGEEEALAEIRQGHVAHVIVDLPPRKIRLLLRVAQAAEVEGVPMQITPAIFPGIHLTPQVDEIARIPMIELCGGEMPLSAQLTKRAFDLVVASVALLALAPVMLIIALALKVTSPGPVFYQQERVGLDGRRFRMLKFRTMRLDAEQQTGPVWARPDDARRTPVGTFLRRTNLDELPQLFNVLAGSMSLVGPRPERPEFVEQFKPVIERYSHKHWVKPGITGWAQVNGWRGQTDLKSRIEHDIYYIEQWSLWLDLKILFLTLVRGYKNAY